MTNLWGFLLQTLSVTLAGGLLLLVKGLMKDKLTPRWQYFVWWVLAVRILLPVRWDETVVLLPLPLWVESLKTMVEQGLGSAYTSFSQVAQMTAPVPWITGQPASVTDWLFVLYVAGVIAMLARYAVSYLRLGWLLRRGEPAGEPILRQVQAVGEKYRLKPCPVVVLPGLPSPMVCGVFRPVLVLPAGVPVGDHVILHELLHVKYRDALQNVFWCLCRALHWCNPLVHLLLNRVGNDLESLCDQRVLERLEGEERRGYGVALLAMANDRYPRAPGTTSISNGGRNISRRIEAIARFKRYPRGMALASVCVGIVLLCGTVTGLAVETVRPVTEWPQDSPWKRAQSLANFRLTRCSTVAGALDTYAKGMITGDKSYLAMASSQAVRQELEGEIDQALMQGEEPEREEFGKGLLVYDMEAGDSALQIQSTGRVADLSLLGHVEDYAIHDLREEPDGTMTGYLAFLLRDLQDFSSPELMGWREALYGLYGVARYGVRLTQENGWVVELTDSRELYLGALAVWGMHNGDLDVYPADAVQQAVGVYGTVTRRSMWVHTVQQETSQNAGDALFGYSGGWLDLTPHPHGSFDQVTEASVTTCTFHPPAGTGEAGGQAGLQVANKKKLGPMPPFPEKMQTGESSWGTEFGGTRGSSYGLVTGGSWNGTISVDGWQSTSPGKYDAMEYAAQIWWDGEPVETLILRDIETEGGK